MYSVPPPKQVESVTNIAVDEVPMQLSDLRTANHMTLQQNGFELVQIPSGESINWDDREQVCLEKPAQKCLGCVRSASKFVCIHVCVIYR